MDGINKNIATPPSEDSAACRQHVSSMLQDRAARLRKEAGALHQEADALEQLSYQLSHERGPREES